MVKVGIAELKSRLSEYLRVVRRGGSVLVLDRDNPIARLVPFDRAETRLEVRRPRVRVRIGEVELPPPLAVPVDIVQLLTEERGDR